MKITIGKMVLLAVTSVLLFSGCATTQQVTEQRRYFWPLPPETPRLEWLGEYNNEKDLITERTFLDQFLGADDEPAPGGLNRPMYVVSNGAGKIYVTDFGDVSVKSMDFVHKKMHRFASGASSVASPAGLAIDGQNNVYVADKLAKKIHVFNQDEKPIRVINVDGKVKGVIAGIAVDRINNRLAVVDITNNMVLLFDLKGVFLLSFGGPGDTNGLFNMPTSVAFNKKGKIIVCDSQNARAQVFNQDGTFALSLGGRGDGPFDFAITKGVAVDSDNNIYVTDGRWHKVVIFHESGQPVYSFGGASSNNERLFPGSFLIPQGVFVDSADQLFVADSMNGRVQRYQYMNDQFLKQHPLTDPVLQKK